VPRTAKELEALLDLERIDDNLFRGIQPETGLQRVFGGQVAAQALVAATRTMSPDYFVHSLHSYFLLPGDIEVPIVYDVEAIRDGRSFATRRVVARQHGRPIYFMTASFQITEDGFDHQDQMPDVRPPEEALDLADLSRARSTDASEVWDKDWAALDVRYLGNSRVGGVEEDPTKPARAQMWIRVSDRLADNRITQAAAFTFASDLTLLGSTLITHGVLIGTPKVQAASLDHTIWFHRPFRADEWWLYDQHSPSASGARGLGLARIFSQDGRLVASVAQEGLIRPR